MITDILNQGFSAIQPHQSSWDSIVTASPTGLENSGYSYYTQNRHQDIKPLEEIKSAILNPEVLEPSLSLDQTSQWNSWNHYVSISQPQNHDSVVHLDEESREFLAAWTVNYKEHFHDTEIFLEGWPGQASDTICGWGSSEQHTRLLRKKLVEVLNKFNVRTLNDAGCGDLAWMRMIDLDGIDYFGYDVHERANWAELRQRGFRLDVRDIATTELRPADLTICRDVFIHLPNNMILPALERFRHSAPLLLTSSYTSDPSLSGGEFSNFKRMNEPSRRHNKLDLTLPPFSLGKPLLQIPEDSPNKYLGLWDLSRPPIGP
ncbi:hypothetical protein N7462_006146 [Penicillium macrosclerotiorum]|uniref:uncharacterized protein n=1 Tax=Penicillium macrosclerotiorum TaxID=303699 RepID=UPI002549104C|nr:uncharacterized protein N7462_006146 [Penicillium macrosclerotiorum]KAJ5682981.1 hypothetical protein N7462_006146 [Penicillium macrosclerotiorum]